MGHVAVAVRVVALEACGEFGGFEASKRCTCKSCCLGGLRGVQEHIAVRVLPWRPAESLEGLRLTRGVQGHVAVRVVALEACGEFGGFEAGQTAGACRWLGHVADRGVALMACA